MTHLILQWGAIWFHENPFNPFDFNQHIIDGNGSYRRFSKGFVYWGKFYREHPVESPPFVLEPRLHESCMGDKGTELCELINYEIAEELPVYLYLYNPLYPETTAHHRQRDRRLLYSRRAPVMG